jgi:nucleoside-diphosphate-sugar epimerase
MRRALITGATGFIGSNLALFLIKNNYSVAVIKRERSDLKALNAVKEKLSIYKSDSYNDICAGMKDFNPDTVIHCAALSHIYNHKAEDIAEFINSNIVFGTYLLEAMKENGRRHFINIGTQWQHLHNKRYCPVNLYAATKEAFKNILIYYESKGIKHKTIELFDTYGEGDTRKKVMELLINACRNKEQLDLTPGGQYMNLTSVEDICAFLGLHIGKPEFFDNQTIALSGNMIKLRDLGALIESYFNAPGILRWGAKQYRDNEIMTPPEYYPKVQLNQSSLQNYIKSAAAVYTQYPPPPPG